MSNIYKFFNYNWFKIIKKNIKNNSVVRVNNSEKKKLFDLVIKKEVCALVFVVINFLITYVSSVEIYKMNYQSNIFFRIFFDNIFISIIWFVVLTILPFITCVMISKKFKSKYYLLLSLIYLFSNFFNIILLIYFITSFINSVILGIIGIINIILTIIINSRIIIELNNYLKN